MKARTSVVLVMAALIALAPAAGALAAPLVTVSLLGRVYDPADPSPDPWGPGWSTIVNVKTGDKIQYELVAEMAPVGTVNNTLLGGVGTTITSLAGPVVVYVLKGDPPVLVPVTLSNGIQSLKFNIYQAAADGVQVSLTNTTSGLGMHDQWQGGGLGEPRGTLMDRGNGKFDILNLRVAQTAGVFVGVPADNTTEPVLLVNTSWRWGEGQDEEGNLIMKWLPIGSAGRLPVTINGQDGVIRCSYKSPVGIGTGADTEIALGYKINGTGIGGEGVGFIGDTDPKVGFNNLTLTTNPIESFNALTGDPFVKAFYGQGTDILSVPNTQSALTLRGYAFAGLQASVTNCKWTIDGTDYPGQDVSLSAAQLQALFDKFHQSPYADVPVVFTATTSSGGTMTDGGTLHILPEPATLALLGLGVAGLLIRRRRS